MFRRRLKPSARSRVRSIVSFEPLEARDVPAAAFALSNNALIAFDTENPGVANLPVAITGLATNETLVGIDVRPQNGQLYGLGYDSTVGTVQLYAISPRTGAAKAVGTTGGPFVEADGISTVRIGTDANTQFGFDFNPIVDRIRVVNDAGQNFRMNPNTGEFLDGDLGAAASIPGLNMDGPINDGTTTVDGAAYTNSFPNTTKTTLYTLDAATDSIFIQNPPNAGTQAAASAKLVTVGGTKLDFTAVGGFDIADTVMVGASNDAVTMGRALASLEVGGTSQLYSIDLTTGEATVIGAITGAKSVQGLALQRTTTGIPAIALSKDGQTIWRFNTNTPGTVTTVTLPTPGNAGGIQASEQLVGIDYRPATGQLYGLGVDAAANTASLYLIDPQGSGGTTTATLVGTAGSIALVQIDGTTVIDLPDPTTAGYGIDFNPTVDKLRVVTSTGLNFRVDADMALAIDGDPSVSSPGINPDGNIQGEGSTGVSATAYTNAFNGTTVTTQYTLDAAQDRLFIQTPPNSGTQSAGLPITVVGVPIDFSEVNGFDIPANVRVSTANGTAAGFGYAGLTVGVITNLYRINLTTGEATIIGPIASGVSTETTGLTLGDSSAGTVSFSNPTPSFAENSKTATLTLIRSGGSVGAATVLVNFANGTATAGSDYDGTPQTITFADGQTTATVTVPLLDDSVFEGDETFTATVLASPTDGNGIVIGANATATVTISENETIPTLSVADASIVEGNTGTTMLTFTVTLSGPSAKTVTVRADTSDLSALAGSDYTAVSNQIVTFAPGQTSRTVMVPIIGDSVLEEDETFQLTLSAPTNAVLSGSPSATGTILNDDTPPAASLSINNVIATEGNNGTTAFTFTISLSQASTIPVTVTVNTTDGTANAGSDYTAIVGQLVTIPAGEQSATVTVNVNGDTTNEADETFNVVLSKATGATIASDTGAGTITNDDARPTLSINDVAVTEGNGGTTTMNFTISLSNPSDQTVTVNVGSSDVSATAGLDYTALANQKISFAPGVVTQTVSVTILGDSVAEQDETFELNLSSPINATIVRGVGTGTILNDDGTPPPLPSLSINDVQTTEGNSGVVTMTFTVTLSTGSAQPVTVQVSTSDQSATAGSDYIGITNQLLTFPPGVTTRGVTIVITPDTVVEPNETFRVLLSNPTNATLARAAGVGTIVNDDVSNQPDRKALVGLPVTAIGADGASLLRVIDANNNEIFSQDLGVEFRGGVRTAVGDVDGDGTPDILVGSGPGTTTRIRVLNGKTGAELFATTPFEASFTGGVFVASGDIDGDGLADLIVSPDEGGGPRVDIYRGGSFSKIASFFGIDDANFRGGARVSTGDVNGDGRTDLVVAAGFQGGPRVAVFDGTTISSGQRVKLFNDFFAFEQSLRNGVFIAVGDINGDGRADLIAGGGPGGGPRVTIFDSATLMASGGGTLLPLGNFFAGDSSNRLGVRLAVKDLDGDDRADLRTVVGGFDQVVRYLGNAITTTGTPPGLTIDGLPNFNGGVFVG